YPANMRFSASMPNNVPNLSVPDFSSFYPDYVGNIRVKNAPISSACHPSPQLFRGSFWLMTKNRRRKIPS
ncbi:MAG: hypothetical protein LBJ64_07330, partial [Deltaproteobacteria bacterium]|nr:hypothetical protein [Deltaproteobacteria bacterium]